MERPFAVTKEHLTDAFKIWNAMHEANPNQFSEHFAKGDKAENQAKFLMALLKNEYEGMILGWEDSEPAKEVTA